MYFAKNWICFTALSAIAAVVMLGCSSQPPTNTTTNPTLPATSKVAGDQLPEGLQKLSDDERTVAIQQDICPVTGQKLGSMGKPPQVMVNGQKVFICCAGCEEELQQNPEKYLAKLSSK